MKADVPVFIVDDDPAVREGLSALLAAKRYKVETYASANEFLASLGPQPQGCLIADIRMSGMSGMELQRELARRGLPIPTVIITGHGDVPLAVAALKAGAVDFLEKPFDSDALLASVAEAMRWGTANSAAKLGFIGPQAGLLKKTEMPKWLARFADQQPQPL